jgi:hypothetical protein
MKPELSVENNDRALLVEALRKSRLKCSDGSLPQTRRDDGNEDCE